MCSCCLCECEFDHVVVVSIRKHSLGSVSTCVGAYNESNMLETLVCKKCFQEVARAVLTTTRKKITHELEHYIYSWHASEDWKHMLPLLDVDTAKSVQFRKAMSLAKKATSKSCSGCGRPKPCSWCNHARPMPTLENKTCYLDWRCTDTHDQLTTERFNRYIRMLDRDIPSHIKTYFEHSINVHELGLSEAAYCYPANNVPVDAMAKHLLHIVISDEHTPIRHPLCESLYVMRESACNTITHLGIMMCGVCHAMSTPGEPLPITHWQECPHFPSDETKLAAGFKDEIGLHVLRRRHAAYKALCSVGRDVREAALHLLDTHDPEIFACTEETIMWDNQRRNIIPNKHALDDITTHEYGQYILVEET